MSNRKFNHIHFFDLDHTLLHANCSFHFGMYLYKKKILRASSMFFLVWNYFLHKIGYIGIQGIHEKSFQALFLGDTIHNFKALVDQFVSSSYDDLINPKIIKILSDVKRNGAYTVILSSSPDFLVEAFAKRLSVDAWQGSVYRTDATGAFVDIEYVFVGDEKSKYVKSISESFLLPIENTTAYSDSHADLPFLESVGCPVAVNPTRTLRRHATRCAWRVID